MDDKVGYFDVNSIAVVVWWDLELTELSYTECFEDKR
jgi:hypothetical protein